MFIIYGRKQATIKKYTHSQDSCKSCKSFDLSIKAYKQYFHIYYIPFFPYGAKTIEIRCKSCGEPNRDVSLQNHYEQNTKTPFYLFSGLILIAALIGVLMIRVEYKQKEKVKFVAAPQVGDVYTIHQDTVYYFLRLSHIKGDTVFAYPSYLAYNGYVPKMQNDDYFSKDDELFYTKQELKEMLEKAEIHKVHRDYSDDEGFNRMK